LPRLGSRVRAPLSAPLHFRTVSSGPFSAKWPSGKAEACKAFTPGSNPGFASRQHPGAPAPVLFYICGHGSVGRAQPCQGWGRGFEPRCPLHCISGPSQAVLFRRSGQVVRQRPAKPLPPVRIRASPPGNIRALRRPFCFTYADMAQLVEHNLAKVGVAGSSPVVRSIWAFSSGGERFPDTEEVRSSNLLTPTKCSQLRGYVLWAVLFWSPNRRQKVPRFMKERF
jgi:hypothetical protein